MDEPKPMRPAAAAASTPPPGPAAAAVDAPVSTAAALDELTDVTEQARDEARRDRTSELELLISGAVLFALFSLVRIADETFLRLMLNVGGGLMLFVILAYQYAKLILYTLLATFVAHLALRAWWIGLVGIHTVFPGGPRWERLRYGPAALASYREELPTVPRLLVRADVLASVVFGTGIAVAAVFALSIVLIAVFGTLAWLLHLAVPALAPQEAFLVVSLPLVALTLITVLIDRLWGARLIAAGRDQPLRRLVRLSNWVAASFAYLPITLVLVSNLPKRRVYAGLILGLVLVMALFLGRDLFFGMGLLSFDSHRYLPAQPAAVGFDPHYYESYRKPVGRGWRLPSIPAEVADGPYVRLFVPILPERVDEGVRKLCPALRPAREAGFHLLGRHGEATPAAAKAETALRDCLLRMTRISLDGKPVPRDRMLLGVHPVSEARGLLAQLPVAQLAAGEHRLVIEELRLPGSERKLRRHVIRFWR